MRTYRLACFVALLCLLAALATAQRGRPSRLAQTPLPKQRVALTNLPAPKADAHGHPPDVRTGTPVASQPPVATYLAVPSKSTTVPTQSGVSSRSAVPTQSSVPTQPPPTVSQPPVAVLTENVPPAPSYQPPSRLPGGDNPRIPPPVVNNGGGRSPIWPIGVGVGAFTGLALWSLPENAAHHVNEELSRNGPQFPESLRMSDFRVTGFAKGGWPVVVDYQAEQGTYVLLTVVTQNAPPAQAVLVMPQTGRRLQLLRLPAEFGATLKSASFSITSTVSATDPTPRYLRVYGFGCGPKAVGSVAIDQLHFGPQAVSTSQPETQFGFHTHSTFDKMKAEFMQVALVDNSVEGTIFDNKKIDGRIAEGESVNDQWSAKKAKSGQIQFRVRGWMTVRGDNDGGDWVSAFSPDLVFKQ